MKENEDTELERLEEFCAWCGEEADPSLRPGAGMGWCGCDPEASCEQA